jgi:hypothetical protein
VKASDERTLVQERGDTSTLAKLYEDLRSFILDPSRDSQPGPRRLGWGVLVRGGMREWMATCLSLSDAVEHDRGTRSDLPSPLVASTQAQLTAALASVLLSRCQGAAT